MMLSSSESMNMRRSLTGVGGAYRDDRTPASSSPGFTSTLILTDFFRRASSAVSRSSDGSKALEAWPFEYFMADLTRVPGWFNPSGRWEVGGVGGRMWPSAYLELCTPRAGSLRCSRVEPESGVGVDVDCGSPGAISAASVPDSTLL